MDKFIGLKELRENMKKILILEDEKLIAQALETNLRAEGFDTQIALNGEEGLAFLKKEKYDLILLDLVMPRLDGFTTLEEIKKKNIKTPVIILSNLSQYGDIKKGLDLGAEDFFIKSNTPLSFIIKKVKEALK